MTQRVHPPLGNADFPGIAGWLDVLIEGQLIQRPKFRRGDLHRPIAALFDPRGDLRSIWLSAVACRFKRHDIDHHHTAKTRQNVQRTDRRRMHRGLVSGRITVGLRRGGSRYSCDIRAAYRMSEGGKPPFVAQHHAPIFMAMTDLIRVRNATSSTGT